VTLTRVEALATCQQRLVAPVVQLGAVVLSTTMAMMAVVAMVSGATMPVAVPAAMTADSAATVGNIPDGGGSGDSGWSAAMKPVVL